MNDDFMTLLDKYRNENMDNPLAKFNDEDVEMPGFEITDIQINPQMQMGDNAPQQEQAIQGLLGNAMNLSNNMIDESQQQTAQAMQAANMLQAQRDQQMSATEQQAAQALERQRQEEQRGLGLLGKLGMMAITGGFGGGGGAVLPNDAGVYSGGWLV